MRKLCQGIVANQLDQLFFEFESVQLPVWCGTDYVPCTKKNTILA